MIFNSFNCSGQGLSFVGKHGAKENFLCFRQIQTLQWTFLFPEVLLKVE